MSLSRHLEISRNSLLSNDYFELSVLVLFCSCLFMVDPIPCGFIIPVATAINKNANKSNESEILTVNALAVFSDCSCDLCLTI